LYLNQGAEEAAKAVLVEGAKINPDEAAIHHNLGLVHLTLGELDEAVSELSRGLELDPDDGMAAYNLATALVRKQRYKEAQFYLKKFLVNPDMQQSEAIEPARQLLSAVGVLLAELAEQGQ
ncbi:MAG TPA: tetratricopeptide repeat protein, partial [Myxococcota bacterium]|nr:tetratricopeptide repeat protein [Myxococcota bacterium]